MTDQNLRRRDRDVLLENLRELDDLPLEQSSEDGFALLVGALRLVTMTSSSADLTSDELLDHITDASWGFPGRRGDGGLDAYWVNEEQREFCLFQSKLEDSISRRDLNDFLAIPEQLLTEPFLNSFQNEAVLDASLEFRDRLSEQYRVRMFYVTTAESRPSDRGRCANWANNALSVRLQEQVINPPHSAEILDFNELFARVDGVLAGSPIDETITIDNQSSFWHVSGPSRVLVTLIPAQNLCEIFARREYRIFRDNPRGPLGSVKTNENIKSTLRDHQKKKAFHILNNGISITCSSVQFPETPTSVSFSGDSSTTDIEIRDFQIVNGLQTTFTLRDFQRRGGDLDGVFVLAKICENPAVRDEISLTSNSQTAITGWDFVSQDPQQRRLQRQIDRIPSVDLFYEIRRGEARYIRRQNRRVPKVKAKELTQAVIAFNGYPVEAKDKIRDVGEAAISRTGRYLEVFNQDTSAYHLLLPWKCWQFVKAKVRALLSEYAESVTTPPDWLGDSRFHLIALVGRGYLRQLNRTSVSQLSEDEAIQSYTSVEDWAPDLFEQARSAIDFIVSVERRTAENSNQVFRVRQLFKRETFWVDFVTQFDQGSFQGKSGAPFASHR